LLPANAVVHGLNDMNKNALEVIEYLVEYTDHLSDNAQDIAEKILFDGSLDDLDALERDTYSTDIEPLLSPDCLGTNGKGCLKQASVESEFVLECYQSGNYLCEECRQTLGYQEAS